MNFLAEGPCVQIESRKGIHRDAVLQLCVLSALSFLIRQRGAYMTLLFYREYVDGSDRY